MHSRSKFYLNICCACLVNFSLSNSLLASDCFSELNAETSRMDQVMDSAKGEQYESILKLFERMQGKWTGQSIRSECKGRDKTKRSIATEYALEASIQYEKPNKLIVKSVSISHSAKTSRQDEFEIVVEQSGLSLLPKVIDGDVRLISFSNSFLAFSTSFKRKNTPITVIRAFSLSGKKLYFEEKLYTRGVLSLRTKWELD